MKIGQILKHYKYISNLIPLFLDFVESSYILQLYPFLTISTFLRIWKYLTTYALAGILIFILTLPVPCISEKYFVLHQLIIIFITLQILNL